MRKQLTSREEHENSVKRQTRKELDELKAEIEEHKNFIDFQVYMDDMKTKDAIIKDQEKQIDDMRKQKRRMVRELIDTKRTLEHRDEMIVKMYDLLRNHDIAIDRKLAIIGCVIDAECDQELTLTEQVVVEMFRRGLFN